MELTEHQKRSLRQAWLLGYRAAGQGEYTLEDNPYPVASVLRNRWEQGFLYRQGVRGNFRNSDSRPTPSPRIGYDSFSVVAV